MSNVFSWFNRRKKWAQGGWISALAIFLTCQAQGQTPQTITIGDFAHLRPALTSFTGTNGTQVVMCAFNGTVVVPSTLTIAGNILLEAATNFNVTIAGSGVRIFQVQSNVTFTLQNIILSGGNSIGTNGVAGTAGTLHNIDGTDGTAGSSGGVGFGGAINNLGTTVAINCIFLTNNASGGLGGTGGAGGNGNTGNGGNGGNGGAGGNGGMAMGGAIYNQGSIVLSNCTFAGNGVIGGNGGVGGTNGAGLSAFPGNGGVGGTALGAGLFNLGRATINACTFDFNFCEGAATQTAGGKPSGNGPPGQAGGAALGGGIYNSGTNVIVNCTFAGNLDVGGTGGNGGQAFNSSLNAGAAGNGGAASGGGLYNAGTGLLNVTNCTFADSSVFGGTNGVIGSVGFTQGVSTGAIGAELGANIANAAGGRFFLKNSILAYPTNGGNAFGTITDQGFNISSDATFIGTTNTTQINLDPLLQLPLATNGGPTLTFDLASGSPAIDAITNPAAGFPVLDQRGFLRPIGTFADIGAVETGTPVFSLSGQLLPSSNNYTQVVINITGSGNTFVVMPDATGFYSIANELPADTYTIIPQTTNGFSFSPVSLTVTLASTNANSVGNNFFATPSFTVSGIISNLSATATVNIFISTNGNNVFFRQTTTAANGIYTFTNVPTQNYLISPVPTSTIAFSPPSLSVTNLSADNTNLNFGAVLPTFAVIGRILNAGGTIVTVNATSSVSASTQTDASGNYTLNLIQGSYTVTPQAPGLSFTPTSIPVTVPPSTNLGDFTAQGGSFNLSGQIANVRNAVALTAVSGGATNNTSSDTSGNYTFANLSSGTYTVTPQPVTGLGFAPAFRSVVVSSSTNAPAFTAMISNYTISGQILLGTNEARFFPNATVLAQGTNAFTSTSAYSAITDANGNYSLTGLPTATYTVTPQPGGFYTPVSNTVPSLSSAVVGVNFRLADTNSTLQIVLSTNGSSLNVSFEKWVPNVTYRIQTSTNNLSWQNLSTNTPGTNTSTVSVPLDMSTNHFFRAVTP